MWTRIALLLAGVLLLRMAAGSEARETGAEVSVDGAIALPCSYVGPATGPRRCFVADDESRLALTLTMSGAKAALSFAYFVRPEAHPSHPATTSGQWYDGSGTRAWRTPLSLPVGRYVISAHGDEKDGAFEADIFLAVLAGKPVVDGHWPIANLRFSPPGCWLRHADPIVQISLSNCFSASSIKLVAARPAGSITLNEYVNNSIESYSLAGIWRVKNRRSVDVAGEVGVSVVLEQSIRGSRRAVEKLFLESAGEYVVVTAYTSDAACADCERIRDWLKASR